MSHRYADFIHRVAKPARYLGGEYQSITKSPASVAARVCLAFPDVYEIGMSHMGTKILYSLLNARDEIACERCFTPWVDMERELREAGEPLISLESQSPLSEFDIVGISLQYELAYTNVLTILDLGGIPLLASERSDGDALVLGGGPNATHPEPMAPFFDAFWIGEAEEELPEFALKWSKYRRAGTARAEALAELASEFPIYVPSLYRTRVDEATGMVVVAEPVDPRVPPTVRRGVVGNLDDYPFPADTPVPYAEAVFDRAGVEIARGCTEGCRFCQAGMIYRPVRERSPDSIEKTLLDGVDGAGYDETSLTSLSTADYSCITPLVKQVMGRLRDRKVSLSVSSLRAYGLNEDILDEMAQMRITGLTFAAEAGSQRMRDVVNKNVTDDHINESSHRVFRRGWHRLKLYFMVGLPTEQDDDVVGIVDTAARVLSIGREYAGNRAEVTVSVSTHVPKPHTPFQWCAQDSVADIARKQSLLRSNLSSRQLRLKVHDRGISYLEGIFARGDRRLAAVILDAWRDGARFDGWDELFEIQRWRRALADHDIDVDAYLGTRPTVARLPWSHIDVGLEDGFLLREYRRALKDRLSPPCGKVRGELIHHTNAAEAKADERKLVCYDCGVACDLGEMRSERIHRLEDLGALLPLPTRPPAMVAARPKKQRRVPTHTLPEKPSQRFRLVYAKTGRAAYLGHLDTIRVLARLFRRAGIELAYTRGFHPKPRMEYSPALSLGVASLGEMIDVWIENQVDDDEVLRRLQSVSPEGIAFRDAREIGAREPRMGKVIDGYRLLIDPASDGIRFDAARLWRRSEAFFARDSAVIHRKRRDVNIRPLVLAADVVTDDAAIAFRGALGWAGDEPLLAVDVAMRPEGSAKPMEVAEAFGIAGRESVEAPRARLARMGFSRRDDSPAGRKQRNIA